MFIVIEGMDGSGKTTAVAALAKTLSDQGYDVVTVADPGMTKIGQQLRSIVKYGLDDEVLEPVSEMLMFQIARHEMTQKIIIPALKENKVVISDRYSMSTTAYQAHGLGLVLETHNANNIINPLTPNLTIYLDVDETTSKERCGKDMITDNVDREKDVIESRSSEYFERVRNGFLTETANISNGHVVDATKDKDAVMMMINSIVRGKLGLSPNEKTTSVLLTDFNELADALLTTISIDEIKTLLQPVMERANRGELLVEWGPKVSERRENPTSLTEVDLSNVVGTLSKLRLDPDTLHLYGDFTPKRMDILPSVKDLIFTVRGVQTFSKDGPKLIKLITWDASAFDEERYTLKSVGS